jgi:hypothetical protein
LPCIFKNWHYNARCLKYFANYSKMKINALGGAATKWKRDVQNDPTGQCDAHLSERDAGKRSDAICQVSAPTNHEAATAEQGGSREVCRFRFNFKPFFRFSHTFS